MGLGVLTLGFGHGGLWGRAGTGGTPLPAGLLGTGQEVHHELLRGHLRAVLVILVLTVHPGRKKKTELNLENQFK